MKPPRLHHVLIHRAISTVTLVLVVLVFYVMLRPIVSQHLEMVTPDVTPSSVHVTCASFQTQAEAQAYFENNHAPWLDANRDGRACQRLP